LVAIDAPGASFRALSFAKYDLLQNMNAAHPLAFQKQKGRSGS
jgi:hypothetical protein